MGNICVWLCFFCGNDVHSREVWAEKNKFHRGDGDSYDNRTDYVVFHGAYSRLVERYRNRFRKKLGFSGAVGDCNERVLALLFPRDPARRREQGCAHRQIEHDIDDTSGVYLVERARFVAAKCMRLYDCRGHVYDD